MLHRHWSRGHFDVPEAPGKNRNRLQYQPVVLARPRLDLVIGQVDALSLEASKADIAVALLRLGLCASKVAASQVAATLDFVDKRSPLHEAAAGLARRLLLTVTELGPVGALASSVHPLAQPYLFIQRLEPLIVQMTEQSATVIRQCRADISALYDALSGVEREKRSRHQTERMIFQAGFVSHTVPSKLKRDQPRDLKQRTFWREDFLHLPPNHPERAKLQAALALYPGMQAYLTALCGDQDQARQLLSLYVTRGLEEIIDWRCGAVPGTLALLRITGALDRHLGGLTSAAREKIVANVAHLRNAIAAAELPIDAYPLLSVHTGGSERRQWGRRAPYGVGRYAVRRGQRVRQRLRPHAPRRRQRFSTADDDRFHKLADTFAEQSGLKAREARDRIRNTITFGGIGLLPRTEWPEAIDRRLLSYLSLFKFGRVDGTLLWHDAMPLINQYASQLGLPPIGTQIVRALLSTQRKPRRWPGGVGPAVYAPRHRQRIMNSGYLRLHRAWRLIPVEFEPKSRSGEHAPKQSAVFVFDLGSARPVGVWVSQQNQVGEQEAALALYQAIWHPGALEWPLRGIPEIIQVDASLATGRLSNIRRAAYALAAEVQIVAPYRQRRLADGLNVFSAHTKTELQEHLDYIVTLIENRLERYGAEYIFDMISPGRFTSRQVQDVLLTWLRHGDGTDAELGCFPHHRSPDVPLEFRRFGLTLPGFDSPAAGALLPVVAEGVSASCDTITFEGRRYGYVGLRLDPSESYSIRTFPYRYENVPDSIFAEDELGQLYYLVAEVGI